MPLAASVLSEREQTVAQYVVDGLTHKEIGAQLYISPKTVEHHVAKIRQKLGASTRAEMLAALKTQLRRTDWPSCKVIDRFRHVVAKMIPTRLRNRRSTARFTCAAGSARNVSCSEAYWCTWPQRH